MYVLKKYGAATTLVFPLIDYGATDFEASPVSHASGDTQISKDEGSFANTTNAFAHEGNGIYSLTITATEMEAATVVVTIKDQTSPKAWEDQAIVIDTYGNASAEHAFDLDVATQGVDVVSISGDSTAADNCELMFDGTGYAGGSAKLGVDVVSISGDSTAANNLEAVCDGTGYDLSDNTFPAVTLADGAHGGTSAVLTLERVVVESTTTNQPAMSLQGDGEAGGLSVVGGSTGPGVDIYTPGTPPGLRITSLGTAVQMSSNGENVISIDPGTSSTYPIRIGSYTGTIASVQYDLSSSEVVGKREYDSNANVAIAADGTLNANVLGGVPAASDIADAVWEEALADHTGTSGSTAEALDSAASGGSAPTASEVADAVWDETMADHVGAGTTGASLNAAGAVGGTGALTMTYTVTDSATLLPISHVKVWVTTDSAGSNLVASGFTNDAGQVTFYLDAGTYFFWRKKAGWDFSNPDTEVVA